MIGIATGLQKDTRDRTDCEVMYLTVIAMEIPEKVQGFLSQWIVTLGVGGFNDRNVSLKLSPRPLLYAIGMILGGDFSKLLIFREKHKVGTLEVV